MAAKSDFAQKLLNDLRVRKEKMAAAQSSSRQTHASRGHVHGNSGQASRGSQHVNTSRRHNNGNTRESSNQMVLYGNGQRTSQHQQQQQLKVRDLSMAIAFAFESNGSLTKIGTSTSNNPLANFFNRFNRRSRDTHKTDIKTFGNRSQFPTVSNIQITQVSKGVQKINQILRACSNGFSLDGKELLKGAIDLEESLRMLVELQEGSQYGNCTQQNKGRLRLLDEDEEDDNAKIAEQWKLDRPKFSFDKKSGSDDAKVGAHKRSTSYVQDMRLSSSSHSVQLEKRGISNVVAKLMGLEEIPRNEDFGLKKNDPKGNVSKPGSNFPEPLGREESNNRQSRSIAENKVNRHQVLDVHGRKQSPTVDKGGKMLAPSNTELQQKGQNSKTIKASEYKTHDSIRHKLGANSTDKEVTRNQQKHGEKRVPLQEPVPKRGEHLEDTKEKNGKHFQRPISTSQNHEASLQVKSTSHSKPKKIAALKKLPREESARSNVKSTKPSEKVPTKDPTNKTDQSDVPDIDISQPNMVNIKKEDEQVHNLSTREPQPDMENVKIKPKDKPHEVSAKQNKTAIIPRKVQRSEISEKIDVLTSRRNANPKKHSAENNMLKDLKQRLHRKNHIGKRLEEQSHDNKVVEDETERIIISASENRNIHEQVKGQEMLQKEDEQNGILNTSIAEECRIQQLQKTPTPDELSDTTARKASDEFWTAEHPYALEDEQDRKQRDQSIGNDIKEEIREPPTRQEQLTEPEKELKEMIIKSQTLLSTADALFKLNIPVSLLHAASEQQEYEDAKNKLVLSCANEVMKRKARRHGDGNPCNRPKVKSLDDLIKQLCEDMETLKSYGGGGGEDVAARLHKMVERDIGERDVDVKSMWEFEWSNVKALVGEKEDVVRDVERWVLNGLVDEVTCDLILVL